MALPLQVSYDKHELDDDKVNSTVVAKPEVNITEV
jgi:hypothetical protein